MHKRLLIFPLLLTLFLLLAACQPPPAPTVAPPEAPTPTAVLEPTAAPPPAVTEKVVISEVLGGIKGNNNYEFIELYNPGSAPLDLDGWSLAYRLGTSEEDIPVYQWRGKTLLPGQGHYLLARAGQDVGVTPDAAFEQALNTFNGGLALYKPDGEIADRLGWGKAPEAFTEGTAAEAMANGVSLERNPGGEAGNAADSDDNAADFTLQEAPHPQNSGSPLTPAVAQRLTIAVAAPEQAEPGSQFEYSLLVGNETGQDVHDVVVEFLLPAGLTIGDLPANVSASDQDTILWTLETLADGDEATILVERLPLTIELGFAGLFLATLIGIPLGILSAIRHNSTIDVGTMVGANVGVSMPVFWLGLMLAYIFALLLKDTPFWLPPSGRLSAGLASVPFYEVYGWDFGGETPPKLLQFIANHYIFNAFITFNGEVFGDAIKHMILPAVALATIPLAVIARMTRSSMLQVTGMDYVRTARAKGISEQAVVMRHAFRNALLPIITIIGLQLGVIFSGAILTETIFSLSGVGRSLFEAITARDFPVIQGFTVVIAIGYITVNLLVDLSYGFLDPRVRLD